MSSGNDPTDSLMAQWEEEIARVEEEKAYLEMEKAREINRKAVLLTDLRKKRNSILPISHLPSEILAIIFTHGAHDHHKNGRNGCSPCIPAWVNVSYVCGRWREIALSCPTLWTYHFNVSLRWTKELVLRSKRLPLKILCSNLHSQPPRDHTWWSSFVGNLLEHSARIQELRLDLASATFPRKFSLYAPLLEDLEIDVFKPPNWSISITAVYTPVLRTLQLRRCPLPWYSLNLSGLNSLSLFCVHARGSNMADFFTALSSMQSLTRLVLEYTLPSAHDFLSSGGLGNSPKIELPCLALLVVTAPLSTVVALLSSINIPFKTQLRLEPLFEFNTSIGDYTPISSFLSRQFYVSGQPSSSCPIPRSLIICAGCYAELTLSSLDHYYEPEIPPGEKMGRNDLLHIGFEPEDIETNEATEMTDYEMQCIISGICFALPSANIQTLHVINPDMFPPCVWKAILGHLSGLRYMKLSIGWMPDLSILSLTVDKPEESLGGKPTHDQNPALHHTFIPALEKLELEGLNFIPDDGTPEVSRMSRKSLLHTLSTRKGLQVRMSVIECEGLASDQAILQWVCIPYLSLDPLDFSCTC